MTENNFIFLENRDQIGVITMDNAPKNPIRKPDFFSPRELNLWIESEKLRGIIIRGAGNHFSSGADLDELKKIARDPDNLFSAMESGKKFLSALEGLEIPVIAAVRGACFGGGLEVALAAHIRVSGTGAMFAFPETDLGLMPGLGGTVRLTGKIGRGKSAQMILSGEIIGADKALEMGIIDYLVPKKEAFDFSLELMKKMTAGRPIEVIRSVMRSINNAATMTTEQAMEEESRMFCSLALGETAGKGKSSDA